jgi:hypothetical protein
VFLFDFYSEIYYRCFVVNVLLGFLLQRLVLICTGKVKASAYRAQVTSELPTLLLSETLCSIVGNLPCSVCYFTCVALHYYLPAIMFTNCNCFTNCLNAFFLLMATQYKQPGLMIILLTTV